MIENGVLVISNNAQADSKICYVGPADSLLYKPNVDDNVIDLSGMSILPGLFNCHVHLDLIMPSSPYSFDPYGPAYRSLIVYRRAMESLRCGTTSIRSTSQSSNTDLAIKKAFDTRLLWGPTIFASGAILMVSGGHGYTGISSQVCNGPDEFRKATREQIGYGADFVKVSMSGGIAGAAEGLHEKQMTDAEITAVTEVAHYAGKKVIAHLSGDAAIQSALKAGVDSIEHAYAMSEETAKMMGQSDCYFVPTLCVTNAYDYLEKHGSPSYALEKLKEAQKTHMKGVSLAHKYGVKISVGTDLLPSDEISGTTATLHEIELLTQIGMTPLEAIQAATFNSANLCSVAADLGTLETGKIADFVVCDGKPDLDISDIRKIKLVCKAGAIVISSLKNFEVSTTPILPETWDWHGGTFKKWM